MTNLYDFLRKLYAQAAADIRNVFQPTDDELAWLEQFLKSPDTEIHFKARDTGQRVDDQPVLEQNYAIAGEEVDVFCLISEAAMLNPQFQKVIRAVVDYLDNHVPYCKACRLKHIEGRPCPPPTGWRFPDN